MSATSQIEPVKRRPATDAIDGFAASAPAQAPGADWRSWREATRAMLPGLLLIGPAVVAIACLYAYPLVLSVVTAFRDPAGAWTLDHAQKAIEFYGRDVAFSIGIAIVSLAAITAISIAIAGYLTLGTSRWAVPVLRWLYRWPLFIPFIVAGQTARSFLARNGMLNGILMEAGILDPAATQSFLDWRGLVMTFAWKQVPFVTLLLAGAMASLDRSTIEAARNLGAGRLRCLFQIVLPQVRPTLMVGLILSLVTILSVLSVPMMLIAGNPTMMTAMMAHRVTYYGDYPVANALGVFSYLITAVAAWVYLRLALAKEPRS